MVVNTNDPDYEHIYSIEAYDDPLDELLYFPPSANQSDGTVCFLLCPQLSQTKHRCLTVSMVSNPEGEVLLSHSCFLIRSEQFPTATNGQKPGSN